MTSRRIRVLVPAMLILSLVAASLAFGASHHNGKPNKNTFEAVLIGHNETPAIHTAGKGTLSLTINADKTMSYVLTYSGLSSAAAMAHVHFGQPDVAGGVSFFLCGGGTKPACPAGNTSTIVTVTGNIAATDVMAIPTQGLPAGDLGAIEEEIADGFTYANVHTANFGGGEIRGQLDDEHGHGHGHADNDD
jgi:hypothetical protein